jgi:hypothetical protein
MMTTEQQPPAPRLLLEEVGARLGRHPAGNLGHRGEQRERTVLELDGLVGDRGDPSPEQPGGQRRIRRQMQIGEDELAFSQHRHFGRLRLLHLEDHVGLAEHGRSVGKDPGSLPLVLLVVDGRPLAGVVLDDHAVPAVDELPHPDRCDRHPELCGLDLTGNADDHVCLLIHASNRIWVLASSISPRPSRSMASSSVISTTTASCSSAPCGCRLPATIPSATYRWMTSSV